MARITCFRTLIVAVTEIAVLRKRHRLMSRLYRGWPSWIQPGDRVPTTQLVLSDTLY